MSMDVHQYVYKKEVDWSVLNYGINIPVVLQVAFKNEIADLKRGQSKEINIVIQNEIYKVKLVNQKFDEKQYSSHKDIVQIRYSAANDIAIKLRQVFYKTYEYLLRRRELGSKQKNRTLVKVPEDSKEYIALYLTEFRDTFSVDCITASNIKIEREIILNQYKDEEDFEGILNYDCWNIKEDSNARVEEKYGAIKIRKLNRSIIDNLKLLYDDRCQICGESFGKKYGVQVAEAHHIDYFIRSFNNDESNILILCPNHHRVIHRSNAMFDKESMIVRYNEKVYEKVILNAHLF